MATERRRLARLGLARLRLARLRILRALAGVMLPLPVVLLLAAPVSAKNAPAWWEPLAFAGQRVTSVSAVAGDLIVTTASGAQVSSDGGGSFQDIAGLPPLVAPPQTGAAWEIRAGVVFATSRGQQAAPDPQAPFLGDSAHLIAAPAALPGVAVAVGTDNHVWRRAPSGQWSTSFILLPAGGLAGAPQVTALAAFTQPLSDAVYMGTGGYGVLVSEDGGDDWIRADPGLPANVLGLATDAAARAVYAATDSGLFVHHLQALPAPPAYHDASLYLRWLGIALVAVTATLLAAFGLRRALPPLGG
jgi:hypothetical protein